MKVSALQEYGLRCLLQLARSSEQGQAVSAEEISRKELLSPAYTEKVLQKLGKAGFIKSIRGAGGGYVLTRSPKEIVIGEVMRNIDGSFFSELCNHFSGTGDECAHISGCGIRPLWANLYKYIYGVLDKTTLSDLMREEELSATILEKNFLNSVSELAIIK